MLLSAPPRPSLYCNQKEVKGSFRNTQNLPIFLSLGKLYKRDTLFESNNYKNIVSFNTVHKRRCNLKRFKILVIWYLD